jgi:hypothetical protein
MFPAHFHIGVVHPPTAPIGSEISHGCRGAWSDALVRVAVPVALLAPGLPGGVSAQALGTMQVSARVLPGRPSWSGLSEAQGLARRLLQAPSSSPATSRTGLVRTRAELASVNGRRRLLVTIHYPHN